jgi:ABC-type uncharacterized transport system substrate-binding protein
MRRRQLIAAFGAAAIGTPFVGSAESAGGLRRIGALMSVVETEPEASRRVKMFMKGLQEQGWRETDVKVEWRWFGSGPDWAGPVADELVAMQPEVLVVSSTALTSERTASLPVVFALVADPVASGFAAVRNERQLWQARSVWLLESHASPCSFLRRAAIRIASALRLDRSQVHGVQASGAPDRT